MAVEDETPDYPVHLFFSREGYLKKITPQSLRMHQVGDDLGVLLGVPYNLNGPVDIQQNTPQALEQVQFLLFSVHGALSTCSSPGRVI